MALDSARLRQISTEQLARLAPLRKRLELKLGQVQNLPRLRRLALPGLFLISLLLFVRSTFPYKMVARRVEAEGMRSGTEISIGDLSPKGLLGLRATDVKVRDAAGGEYNLARVDVTPDLLPLLLRRTAFSFVVEGYGGTARGHARLASDPRVAALASLQLDAADLDLHALPLPISPQDAELVGRISLKLDLPALEPLEAGSGHGTLTVKGARVTRAVARLEGGMTMTLPQVSFGDVEAALVLEKGAAKIERLSARGGDVEADVDGSVALRPALALSQADLHLKVRPSEHWMQQNPLVRGALGFLGPRAGDGSYTVSLSGPLARLQSRPGR
jgi:type II secretion system protein N